jgi:hypothetical protein
LTFVFSVSRLLPSGAATFQSYIYITFILERTSMIMGLSLASSTRLTFCGILEEANAATTCKALPLTYNKKRIFPKEMLRVIARFLLLD